ncbi:hypothetical protein ACFRMQ_00580 [Kitasatospora sp. NPDC056783]|uniref:hypothetical protein n=1 Tax=Kitasatospora sp. NPDC056783 TaxID=3345943 RepID=UPI003691B52B
MTSHPAPSARRHAATDLAKARATATGEPHQLARAEITAHGSPLPAPGHPDQEVWEARILAALLTEYGSHRPTETDGPYGIARVTPRPDELVVHVGRAQLARWARALLPVQRAGGALTGVAGLRWSTGAKDVVLHPAGAPQRRVRLATTFARDWSRAVAGAVERGDVLLADAPDRAAGPGEREAAAGRAQRERVVPCAGDLSAVLRRVLLLEHLAARPFHGGAVEFTVDAGRLVNLSAGRARLSAPWITLRLIRSLWPDRTPAKGRSSASDAMLPLLARYPTLPGAVRPGGARHGLCELAGVRVEDVALRAAGWALEVADAELAEPNSGFLDDEGGWTGNRRRFAEDFIGESGPLDPPGCARLLARCPVDFADLGRLDYLPAIDHEAARELRPDHEQLTEAGRQILIRLLDWALAAATHQVPARAPWQQADPANGSAWSADRQPAARWTAAMPLLDSPAPLQLRVEQRRHGGFGYAVHPGPEGVPAWVHHATPALRFASTDSLPAAMLLAEHAGREVAAGARTVRSFDRRLLIPRPVPADADPQPAELIAAAAPREMVLDLYELCAGLRALADLDRQDEPYLYNPPADGHWRQGPDGPEPGTVSAMLGEDHVLAATRPGEPANTAAVDTPAYRRHLAAHQIAVDPLAEIYLTAAEALPGLTPLHERHRAGAAALHGSDIPTLLRQDPRPQHPGEDLPAIVAALPTDVHAVEDFFEQWYQQREGSDRSS